MRFEQVEEVFTEARQYLATECGIVIGFVPRSVADQAQTRFRQDILSIGLDPADENVMHGVFAGLAIGLKLLVGHASPPVLAMYTATSTVFLEGAANIDDAVSTTEFDKFIAGWFPEEYEQIEETREHEPPPCESCEQPAVCVLNGSAVCGRCFLERITALTQELPGIEQVQDDSQPVSWWKRMRGH